MPLTVIIAPTGPEEGLLSTAPAILPLFASAGETKCAVIYNDAARHNITLTARQIALASLAPCFITTKFLRQRALQVEKHIKSTKVVARYIPPQPSVGGEELTGQAKG